MAVDRADLVVVGAGTVGGWASYFARLQGAERVVVIDRGRAGDGASSRAAGMVRAQGGNPTTVALGRGASTSSETEASAGHRLGLPRARLPIFAQNADEVRAGRERVPCSRPRRRVRWLSPDEAVQHDPPLAATASSARATCPRTVHRPSAKRSSLFAGDAPGGRRAEGEHSFLDCARDRPLNGVETSAGPIETPRVILTGGPTLREVGRAAGVEVPVGAVRHQVAVTEPHAAFDVGEAGHGF